MPLKGISEGSHGDIRLNKLLSDELLSGMRDVVVFKGNFMKQYNMKNILLLVVIPFGILYGCTPAEPVTYETTCETSSSDGIGGKSSCVFSDTGKEIRLHLGDSDFIVTYDNNGNARSCMIARYPPDYEDTDMGCIKRTRVIKDTDGIRIQTKGMALTGSEIFIHKPNYFK